MRIVGYHIWNGIIANSDGQVCISPPYIDFLLQKQKDEIGIMYNLAQNVSALAKMCNMTEEEGKLLHDSSQKKVDIPPYKLRYVKDRFINLQKGYYKTAPYGYFYDAHQYKDTKTEDDDTVDKCIEKAKIAQQIGQEVFMTFNELGMHTERLISPVRAFEDTVLKKLKLSGIDDIPEEAGYFAYEGCLGNWLEAFQIGCWDKVWDYDINSAYPAIIAQQMDLKDGEWIEGTEYVPKARYAECLADVNVKSNFSPVMFRAGERNNLPLNYTPTGKREMKIGKRLIDYIMLYKQDEIKIKKGHWWIPNKECDKPLQTVIQWLFLEKEKAAGLKKEVIKRIMAGIYGKMLQTITKEEGIDFGDYFNPVWAEDIETATRIEVAEFVMRNKLDVIHVAVDGVTSASPAELGDNGLGKWKLSNISPCICAGTGNIALVNNNGNGHKDFSLTYDKVRKLIEENPEKSEYKLEKLSPVTLAEALNGKWDKKGTLQVIEKWIGIGQDEKRCYKERPKNGGELLKRRYKSEPWDVSMVRNLEEVK